MAPAPQGLGSHGFLASMQPLIVLGLSKNPGRQVHFAKPLERIAHCVLGPHGDGSHGFVGRAQGICGGVPSNSGRQKHTALPPTTRHPEFGPQGLGEHSSPSGTEKERYYFMVLQIRIYIRTAIFKRIAC